MSWSFCVAFAWLCAAESRPRRISASPRRAGRKARRAAPDPRGSNPSGAAVQPGTAMRGGRARRRRHAFFRRPRSGGGRGGVDRGLGTRRWVPERRPARAAKLRVALRQDRAGRPGGKQGTGGRREGAEGAPKQVARGARRKGLGSRRGGEWSGVADGDRPRTTAANGGGREEGPGNSSEMPCPALKARGGKEGRAREREKRVEMSPL